MLYMNRHRIALTIAVALAFAGVICGVYVLGTIQTANPPGFSCQSEEGGVVVGYAGDQTPRRGFDAVPCDPDAVAARTDCREVGLPAGAKLMYVPSAIGAPGAWYAEHDGGWRTIGYSVTEDSTIYPLPTCQD